MNQEFNNLLGAILSGEMKPSDIKDTNMRRKVVGRIGRDTANGEEPKMASLLRRLSNAPEGIQGKVLGGQGKFREVTKSFIAKITSAGTKIVFVSTNFFQPNDAVRAIGERGLPKGKDFFLTQIRMQSAVNPAASASVDDATVLNEAAAVDFGVIGKELRTSLLNLKVGAEELFDKYSCGVFDTRGCNTVPQGVHTLGNPFWIEAEKPVEMLIDNGAAIPANTFVLINFVGFEHI